MNAATAAGIAAWNAISEQELPAGTKVTVEGAQVTIHPPGAQPTHLRYSSTDTLSSIYDTLEKAVRAIAEEHSQKPARQPLPTPEGRAK